eukprot:gene4818-3460_t
MNTARLRPAVVLPTTAIGLLLLSTRPDPKRCPVQARARLGHSSGSSDSESSTSTHIYREKQY